MDISETIQFFVHICMIGLTFGISIIYAYLALRSKHNQPHNTIMIAWTLCYTIRYIIAVNDGSALALAIPNCVAITISILLLCIDKDKTMRRIDIIYLLLGIAVLATDIPDLLYVEREIYDGVRNHKIYFAHSV